MNIMPHAEREPQRWPWGTLSLGLALSHVFQYTTIDTNEKKINLKEEKKIAERGRTWQLRGRRFQCPEGPKEDI